VTWTSEIPDPGADEQASLWAARLECAQLSSSQKAALEAWLAGEPGRRPLLARYCSLSAKLDIAVPELAAAGAFDTAAKPARERIGWSPLRIAVAGLAAAILTVSVVWYGWGSGRPERIAAAVGERRSFTLADGSHIELNANTSILVENGRAERRVRLDSGEAFFVVSKDKSRPFIVETPAGSVRVTGTQFNVLTETASQLEVTVVEGTVQVRPGAGRQAESADPLILGAGDRVSVEEGGSRLRALSSSEVYDALAWRNGRIVCAGIPLSEVLARVGHFHGIRITATAGAANLRLDAISNLDNLDSFLSDLEQGLTVRVKRQPDGSIIVGLPTEP
jgi:transmembrane sensor